MSIKKIQILILISVIGIFSSLLQAQEEASLQGQNEQNYENAVHSVFNEIESGISSGRVSLISRFFSAQIYLNLSNGTTGYYSSNQAYYVLEDFFKNYQVTSFSLDNIQTDETNPFATGGYQYIFKGKHETAQVYVSLKHVGKKWKITQITIN